LIREKFMRTTLNLNDELLAQAAVLTGVTEKTALVRLGLETLIARESAKRLAALGPCEHVAAAFYLLEVVKRFLIFLNSASLPSASDHLSTSSRSTALSLTTRTACSKLCRSPQ
jgi:Arc/MetJ family transcription regulator